MSTHTIQVTNASGNDQTYSLFYEPFVSQSNPPLPCITMKSEVVANGNNSSFPIELPSVVVCGNSLNTTLGQGVNINIGQSAPITTPETVKINVQNNIPSFTSHTASCPDGDWAELSTMHYDYNPDANIFCGLGVRKTTGEVIPSCVWEIQPTSNYPIPKLSQPLVFYITSNSGLEVGTITTVEGVTPVATVDFTGTGGTFCEVKQLPNNSFEVGKPTDARTSQENENGTQKGDL